MTQAAAHWLWHEGISATRLRGVHKGRPASIAAPKIAALKAEGLGATEIAKRFKIGRASVYRVLASRGCPRGDIYVCQVRRGHARGASAAAS
jgi:DNA invertase Pin-like site-specific DNA recombinase